MSFWKKTMDYLGLGPDDAYEDYDEQADAEPPPRSSRSSGDGGRNGRSSGNRNWPSESDETVVKAVPARPSFPSRDFESPAPRRPQPPVDDSGAQPRPPSRSSSGSSSRPPSNTGAEPVTVRPRRFDQAQE